MVDSHVSVDPFGANALATVDVWTKGLGLLAYKIKAPCRNSLKKRSTQTLTAVAVVDVAWLNEMAVHTCIGFSDASSLRPKPEKAAAGCEIRKITPPKYSEPADQVWPRCRS